MSLAPALTINTVTVPDDVRLVVRDIDAVEVSGTANSTLVVYNAAGGLLWTADRLAAAGNFNAAWRGRQVYTPGQLIKVQVVSGTWEIQISGYELSLV